MIGVRLIAFHSHKAAGNKKLKKPQNLFELDIDKKLRKARISRMKPIEVIKEKSPENAASPCADNAHGK